VVSLSVRAGQSGARGLGARSSRSGPTRAGSRSAMRVAFLSDHAFAEYDVAANRFGRHPAAEPRRPPRCPRRAARLRDEHLSAQRGRGRPEPSRNPRHRLPRRACSSSSRRAPGRGPIAILAARVLARPLAVRMGAIRGARARRRRRRESSAASTRSRSGRAATGDRGDRPAAPARSRHPAVPRARAVREYRRLSPGRPPRTTSTCSSGTGAGSTWSTRTSANSAAVRRPGWRPRSMRGVASGQLEPDGALHPSPAVRARRRSVRGAARSTRWIRQGRGDSVDPAPPGVPRRRLDRMSSDEGARGERRRGDRGESRTHRRRGAMPPKAINRARGRATVRAPLGHAPGAAARWHRDRDADRAPRGAVPARAPAWLRGCSARSRWRSPPTRPAAWSPRRATPTARSAVDLSYPLHLGGPADPRGRPRRAASAGRSPSISCSTTRTDPRRRGSTIATHRAAACVIDLGVHLVDPRAVVARLPGVTSVDANLLAGGLPLEADSASVRGLRERCSSSSRPAWRSGSRARGGSRPGANAVIEGPRIYGNRRRRRAQERRRLVLRLSSASTTRARARRTSPSTPDSWGGRAAVAWAEQLAAGTRFEIPRPSHLVRSRGRPRPYLRRRGGAGRDRSAADARADDGPTNRRGVWSYALELAAAPRPARRRHHARDDGRAADGAAAARGRRAAERRADRQLPTRSSGCANPWRDVDGRR